MGEWEKEQERRTGVRQTDRKGSVMLSGATEGDRSVSPLLRSEGLEASSLYWSNKLLAHPNLTVKQCHSWLSIRINSFKCIHGFSLQWHKMHLFMNTVRTSNYLD